MTDKSQWMADFAEDIESQYTEWEQLWMQGDILPIKDRLDTIVAIVSKHCPENKAVGKLVEVCKRIVAEDCHLHQKEIRGSTKRSWCVHCIRVREAKAALAEYEANK